MVWSECGDAAARADGRMGAKRAGVAVDRSAENGVSRSDALAESPAGENAYCMHGVTYFMANPR